MKPNIPGVLITFALVWFALVQNTQAVSPPPDGGYPGGNTAEGQNALLNLNSGSYNTAVGFLSLSSNADTSFNTAIGAGALLSNTADNNTAVGAGALLSTTFTGNNTAMGTFALFNNKSGANSAFGVKALFSNGAGSFNTALGYSALIDNTGGEGNTAVGDYTLQNNTEGNLNVALGEFAGGGVSTASNVICLGANVPGANVSFTTWIGNVFGVATQSGTTAAVIVSTDGQLGTVASSERFKKDIASMDKTSDALLLLRPVTFHYKTDSKGAPQFGLIAEEVAKVNPALVLPDKEGKPYTVRYDAVNAMLLNEFLKEHKKTEKLEATVASLIATVKEQAAQIQKVSAQLEASKPTPHVATNNR
jgi:trimeric autotransporter adhesin